MLQNGDKIEYQILVGQATNLALENIQQSQGVKKDIERLELCFNFFFNFLLEKRNDEKLQAKFLRARQKAELKKETKEKERDSAGNDVADFGENH